MHVSYNSMFYEHCSVLCRAGCGTVTDMHLCVFILGLLNKCVVMCASVLHLWWLGVCLRRFCLNMNIG